MTNPIVEAMEQMTPHKERLEREASELVDRITTTITDALPEIEEVKRGYAFEAMEPVGFSVDLPPTPAVYLSPLVSPETMTVRSVGVDTVHRGHSRTEALSLAGRVVVALESAGFHVDSTHLRPERHEDAAAWPTWSCEDIYAYRPGCTPPNPPTLDSDPGDELRARLAAVAEVADMLDAGTRLQLSLALGSALERTLEDNPRPELEATGTPVAPRDLAQPSINGRAHPQPQVDPTREPAR